MECPDAGLDPVHLGIVVRYHMLESRDKGPILVLSGSCAIVNGEQIKWAKAHGFVDTAVRVENILDNKNKEM